MIRYTVPVGHRSTGLKNVIVGSPNSVYVRPRAETVFLFCNVCPDVNGWIEDQVAQKKLHELDLRTNPRFLQTNIDNLRSIAAMPETTATTSPIASATTSNPPAPPLDAVAARIAELSLPAPASTGRSLLGEYKAINKKYGKKMYPRGCLGPDQCKNVLCDHKYAPPGHAAKFTTAAPDPPAYDEKVLGMLMSKAEKDGYRISRLYAILKLSESAGKFVPALNAVKTDIDSRYQKIHATGRLSIKWESQAADLDIDAPNTKSLYNDANRRRLPIQRDAFCTVLEEEDVIVAEVLSKGYTSTLMTTYHATAEKRGLVYRTYCKEAMFRNARQAFHEQLQETHNLSINDDDYYISMAGWDDEHDVESDCRVWSPFRHEGGPIPKCLAEEKWAVDEAMVPMKNSAPSASVEDSSEEPDSIETSAESTSIPVKNGKDKEVEMAEPVAHTEETIISETLPEKTIGGTGIFAPFAQEMTDLIRQARDANYGFLHMNKNKDISFKPAVYVQGPDGEDVEEVANSEASISIASFEADSEDVAETALAAEKEWLEYVREANLPRRGENAYSYISNGRIYYRAPAEIEGERKGIKMPAKFHTYYSEPLPANRASGYFLQNPPEDSHAQASDAENGGGSGAKPNLPQRGPVSHNAASEHTYDNSSLPRFEAGVSRQYDAYLNNPEFNAANYPGGHFSGTEAPSQSSRRQDRTRNGGASSSKTSKTDKTAKTAKTAENLVENVLKNYKPDIKDPEAYCRSIYRRVEDLWDDDDDAPYNHKLSGFDDIAGQWDVEMERLFERLGRMNVEITGARVTTDHVPRAEIDYILNKGPMFYESVALTLWQVCSACAPLAVAFWIASKPLLTEHLHRRGETDFRSKFLEEVLMRFCLRWVKEADDAMIANAAADDTAEAEEGGETTAAEREEREKREAEEVFHRNNPKAAEKAEKKALKKAQKKAGKRK